MKFYDLGLGDPAFRADLDAAYRRVMDSGWMVLGREVEAFETEFAAYCGADQAIGVGNGLDALILALRAAGIGPGDEVIVPSHTFAATWLAVRAVGATPRPAEVDPVTFTLDPSAAAAAVTPRTAAILPVSLYGHPVEMRPIMALAERHGLFVLEDAAQAHGATYEDRRTGALAHATAFSFYPTKNLGAFGDAGAVVTSDSALAEKVRILRNYGSRRKYLHEVAGVNSRLDELQAAFLRVRLGRLDVANQGRRVLAQSYSDAFRDIAGLRPPSEASWARHVYHLYVVQADEREGLQARLRRAGVETLIHYPVPCHLQPAFADLGLKPGDLPIAERLAQEVLSLPLWPDMATGELEQVIQAIAESD
jgi:dTDP-4-amino-4,6-dideoxygalactose transaminase